MRVRNMRYHIHDIDSSVSLLKPISDVISQPGITTDVWNVGAIRTHSLIKRKVEPGKCSQYLADNLSKEAICDHQMNDACIGPVLRYCIHFCIEKNSVPTEADLLYLSSESQQLFHQWQSLKVTDRILYRTFVDGHGEILHCQLVIPTVLKQEVMQQMHTSLTIHHILEKHMLPKPKQYVWWPSSKQWRI